MVFRGAFAGGVGPVVSRSPRSEFASATMSEIKITKRVVDAALPRASRYTLFDSLIPGFGLRVFPTGVKSWVFRYRPGAGGRNAEQKSITIGRVGEFTPDQARKRADALRATV